MVPERPILLVHGAWHGAWCWAPLQERLSSLGIRSVAIDLPGHGARRRLPWLVRWRDYIEAVRDAAVEFDVPPIVVGHSMGGGVITGAAELEPDLFAALVYVAAFVPQQGESILALAKQDRPMPGLRAHPLRGEIQVPPDDAIRNFFHDCQAADHWAGLVQPQPFRPTRTGVQVTPERQSSIPRYYVNCRQDRAISSEFQLFMARRSAMRRIFEMDCGHSPFLAAPDRLAAILAEIRGEISAADGEALP